jgi:hypothetical protein
MKTKTIKGKGVLDKYFGILSGSVENARADLKRRKKESMELYDQKQNVLFGHNL